MPSAHGPTLPGPSPGRPDARRCMRWKRRERRFRGPRTGWLRHCTLAPACLCIRGTRSMRKTSVLVRATLLVTAVLFASPKHARAVGPVDIEGAAQVGGGSSPLGVAWRTRCSSGSEVASAQRCSGSRQRGRSAPPSPRREHHPDLRQQLPLRRAGCRGPPLVRPLHRGGGRERPLSPDRQPRAGGRHGARTGRRKILTAGPRRRGTGHRTSGSTARTAGRRGRPRRGLAARGRLATAGRADETCGDGSGAASHAAHAGSVARSRRGAETEEPR